MQSSLSLLGLGFVSVLALTTTACRGPQDGTVEASMDVGGRSRSYLYHLPPSHGAEPAKQYPLVLALHGRMGDGEKTERETKFTHIAEREGFVVAYPDGIDESWHDYRDVGPAAEQGVDDVAFLSALIDKLIAEQKVDPKRVYVTGLSNGGMMTFRLACEIGDKLAAIAPVISLMPENGLDLCNPSRPIPIAIFAGTEDPLIPYGGGDVAFDRGRVISADATRAKWATINGCDPKTNVEVTIDRVDDGTRVLKSAHTTCKEQSEVVLYSLDGAGHTWPGGTQYLPKIVIGKISHDIDGAEEIWQFFKKH